MEYIVNDSLYSWSYSEMKRDYERICLLTDEEFISDLKNILHLACFVSYIKELGSDSTLGDEGIIHQLVHLMCLDDPIIDIKEIREQFETLLKLA